MEGITLSEICQTKTSAVCYHLYVESKKYNKLVNITKKQQTNSEQTSGHQWGKCREGQNRSRGVGNTNYWV